MEPLFTSSQSRAADAYAIEELGLSELVLMEHAALAVVHALKRRFGRHLFRSTRGVCVAGPGNNGGDAIAVARLMKSRGVEVSIACVGNSTTASLATQTQKKIAQRLGIPILTELNEDLLDESDWIVDGIFGTGLSRSPEGTFLSVIRQLNAFAGIKWIVAIDVPSGLSADTGVPLGAAVSASETVALGALKRGLVTGYAADSVGLLSLSRIEIPKTIPGIIPNDFLFCKEDLALPPRTGAGHKGLYGHVYVWASELTKCGAATFAALAALRAGAGLVTVLGPSDRLAGMRPLLPPDILMEEMQGEKLRAFTDRVLALGPGMGVAESDARVLQNALESTCSLVLDADALNLLYQQPVLTRLCLERPDLTILTPHPKEAARLLGESTETVQNDRFAAATEIARRYNAWVILKGRGSLVCGPPTFDSRIVVNNGTSGLSKGGTGDVLTGVVASLLAQGASPEYALPLGSFLIGEAAERFAQRHGEERTVLPSDLVDILPSAFQEIARYAR